MALSAMALISDPTTEDRTVTIELPTARSVLANPSQAELRTLVADMPNAVRTVFGNYNVTTHVTARSAGSTFVIADDGAHLSKPTMDRASYAEQVARQEAHIADADMLLVEGYIGPSGSPLRRPARVFMERTHANIPAMQAQLYYPRDAAWRAEDALTVVYTPNLSAPGFPGDKLVTIDLEAWVTRVFGIDYFGESKMGGLRMWMEWAFQQGSLPMHAGAKVIPTSSGVQLGLIIGLSGTGKTTTTFTRQNGSLPVQDDIVAITEGGQAHATENGCFAKTYGLDPDDEPTIHGALTRPESWLENVAIGPDGVVDFFDDSYTANGRGTFPLSMIEHSDPAQLGTADFLLILNANETIAPAVAKMPSIAHAVAYFMLGETKGTSAGGAEEAGKSLRVPGTNPFFMGHEAEQGVRLAALLETMPDFEVFVLNTGRIGGSPEVSGSKKVKIPHTSAVVKAIAEGTISWQTDPDFGYLVASDVPDFDDPELLNPRALYGRLGRLAEYEEVVAGLKAARVAFLEGHHGLPGEVIDAVR